MKFKPESQTLDYKDFSKNREHLKKNFWYIVSKSICSYANADGGELWIGIETKKNTVFKIKEQPDWIKRILRDQSNIERKIKETLSSNVVFTLIPIKKSAEPNSTTNFEDYYIIKIKPLKNGKFCSIEKELIFNNKKLQKGEIYKRNNCSIDLLLGDKREEFLIEKKAEELKNTYNLPQELDPIKFTENWIFSFLYENIFNYSDFHFRIENIFEDYEPYIQTDIDLSHFSYMVVKSFYMISNNKNKINWNKLIFKIENIWQNNILIKNIKNILIEKIPRPYEIRGIFYPWEKQINSLLIERIENSSPENLNFNLLLKIWEYLFIHSFVRYTKTISYFKFNKILWPFDNNFNDFIIQENFDSLKNILEINLEIKNLKEITKFTILKDLRKITIDFWYYFHGQEKRNLKDVLDDAENIYDSFLKLDDKKLKVLKLYFQMKNIFEQKTFFDFYKNEDSILFSEELYPHLKEPLYYYEIDEYISKTEKYIYYLEKINNFKEEYQEKIFEPLINSLLIFDNKNNKLEKLVYEMIYNHILIIIENLNSTLFYIPDKFLERENYIYELKYDFFNYYINIQFQLELNPYDHIRYLNFDSEESLNKMLKSINKKIEEMLNRERFYLIEKLNQEQINKIKNDWNKIKILLLKSEISKALKILFSEK